MQDPIVAVVTAVSLFSLGILSPGPNFFVVTQRTLSRGRKGGVSTALGVVAGDVLYASAGLIGLSSLIQVGSVVFTFIKFLGGLYLIWLGVRMLMAAGRSHRVAQPPESYSASAWRSFVVGLMTCLANPKTVLFFTTIFAVSLRPELPAWVGVVILAGIVVTSVVWRLFLVAVFSTGVSRRIYVRFQTRLERAFGVFLMLFGVRMAIGAARD